MKSAPALDLLLADADERAPVLADGLPAETAALAPKPKKTDSRHESNAWRQKGADQNDLKLQRWAVLAPEGADGDRMLEAIEPLKKLRQEEQDAEVIVYRVPPDMDARQAVRWKEDVYWSEEIAEAERPYYLMMLGDLRHVSLELQQVLANAALVGRACFDGENGAPDPARYAAYADKLVRYARAAAPDRAPDLLFHVAADGTRATVEAESKLVAPSMEAALDSLARGKLPAASVRRLEAESASGLLSEGADTRPAVLLSVSHGVGAPRGGWRSEERQRREQGALLIGEGDVLTAERLAGQTFLPGGLWFCLACFGAGTPEKSAYHPWLKLLAEEQAYRGKADAVLASLPSPGQHPFIAALPQAALASPGGPLAVIGHVDLAWTYGFSAAQTPAESRKSRVLSTLEVMVRGARAGVALDRLLDVYREVNDSLMMSYEGEESARRDGRADPTDRRERGHLWMSRNDLRGYVLLGDPAARLSLEKNTLSTAQYSKHSENVPEIQRQGTARAAASPSAVGAAERAAAVAALLQGDETPRAIAERAGVGLAELWQWFDAHRTARA